MLGRRRERMTDRERVEEQERQQEHQTVQAATLEQPGNPEISREYIRELTRHELDDATEELLHNVLSHDLVLGNLKDAEVTETRWLLENIFLAVKREHPSHDSFVEGEYRKFLLDDETDGLKPLSSHQEVLLEQARIALINRLTRSRGGWQQEEMGKQVAVSRREDVDRDESNGTIGGLFS